MAQVYTDFSGLAALKARAREDQDAALDQVSRQFESLFLQMMLKSMRDASSGGGLMDSKQSEFYRDMYDKQIAVDMAQTHGIGLADVAQAPAGWRHLCTLRWSVARRVYWHADPGQPLGRGHGRRRGDPCRHG